MSKYDTFVAEVAHQDALMKAYWSYNLQIQALFFALWTAFLWLTKEYGPQPFKIVLIIIPLAALVLLLLMRSIIMERGNWVNYWQVTILYHALRDVGDEFAMHYLCFKQTKEDIYDKCINGAQCNDCKKINKIIDDTREKTHQELTESNLVNNKGWTRFVLNDSLSFVFFLIWIGAFAFSLYVGTPWGSVA